MIPIRKCGRFFKVDPVGFLINDTSFDYIPSAFQTLLDELVEIYRKQLGANLHSIYLRGSLPRGLYIEGFSDIDTFALVRSPEIRWEKPTWADQSISNLNHQLPSLPTIEVMLSSYHPDLQATYPQLAMQIKTQSLCLYGQDIRSELVPYRIGPAMMQHFNWLTDDLVAFQDQDIPNKSTVRQLMKTFVRTGFELVMERAGQYSPDLYYCYQTFAQYYPNLEGLMRQALGYYLNPTIQKDDLADVCQILGPFLQKEVEKRLKER